METIPAVNKLAALAQASRLAVFRWLVQRGPEGACPGEIAEQLQLAAATLSFHLKALQHAGLIQAQPSGRNIRYTADFAAMRELLAYLTENCCGGAASACEVLPDPAACCMPDMLKTDCQT